MAKKTKTGEMSANEKWAWGGAGAALGILNYLITGYIAFYFTDVMLISAAALVPMMFFARVLDAAQDIGIGIAVDRTRRKDGQCRPYYKWFALPYLASCIVMFLNPPLNGGAKLAFGFIAYTMMLFMASFVGVPSGAQSSLMSKDNKDITDITSIRFLFTNIVSVAFGLVCVKLLEFFGGGDMKKGFLPMGTIIGVIGVASFAWAYIATNDRHIAPLPEEKPKIPLIGDLKYLKNWPWLSGFLATLFLIMSYGINLAVAIYYFTHIVPNQDLAGLALAIIFVFMMPGGIAASFVSQKIGKKNAILSGIMFAMLGKLFMATETIPGIFLGLALAGLGMGLAVPLMGSLMPDIVDYGEWKNGASTPGILNSAISLGTKLGGGFATSIALLVLASGGYDASLPVQPESAKQAVRFAYIYLPLIFDILAFIFLAMYPILKFRDRILSDLALRHSGAKRFPPVEKKIALSPFELKQLEKSANSGLMFRLPHPFLKWAILKNLDKLRKPEGIELPPEVKCDKPISKEQCEIDGTPNKVGVKIFEDGLPGVKPLFFFIHGGGFLGGDSIINEQLLRVVADKTGAVSVAVDYNVSPECQYPAPLDDCERALRFALKKRDIDPAKIFICGDSAGGNLTIALTMRLVSQGELLPKGQIMLYPVTNMDSLSTESHWQKGPEYLNMRKGILITREIYLSNPKHRRDPLVSPMLAEFDSPQPDALSLVAQRDALRCDGLDFAEKLARAGGYSRSVLYVGAFHSFINDVGRSDIADDAAGEIVEFIKARI
ncbi:MAG: glycoside-pentoside-hexuronide (GPH):cation symporter [Clostridiales bacterium]|nr:glycoside-pentoside-hexuronide (GPH):cation symporter [Clostridiales bacterium]